MTQALYTLYCRYLTGTRTECWDRADGDGNMMYTSQTSVSGPMKGPVARKKDPNRRSP